MSVHAKVREMEIIYFIRPEHLAIFRIKTNLCFLTIVDSFCLDLSSGGFERANIHAMNEQVSDDVTELKNCK